MIRERIYYWDNVKGFLILMVVLGHYVETFEHQIPGAECLWTAIYSFHMPGFVIVNGVFLGMSKKNPIEKIPRTAGLYLLMTVLYAVRPLLYGTVPEIQLGMPPYGCWYLLFLSYGYVVAFFLKKGKDYYIFTGVLIAALLAGLDTSIGRLWGIGQSFYFMPYLVGGACLGIEKAANWFQSRKWAAAAGFFLLQAGLFVLGNLEGFNRRFFRGLENYGELCENPLWGIVGRGTAYVISTLLVICLLGMIPRRKTALSVLGRHTLVVYLVHTFLIKNIEPELERLGITDWRIRAIVLTGLIIAACIGIIWLQTRRELRKRKEESGC